MNAYDKYIIPLTKPNWDFLRQGDYSRFYIINTVYMKSLSAEHKEIELIDAATKENKILEDCMSETKFGYTN